MNIRLNFDPTISDSDAIIDLNNLIKSETNITSELVKKEILDSKGDLSVAIDIISLLLTSVSTFITVLEYWNNKYPKYSLTVKVGEATFNKENLSKQEFEDEIKKAREDSSAEILVTKK